MPLTFHPVDDLARRPLADGLHNEGHGGLRRRGARAAAALRARGEVVRGAGTALRGAGAAPGGEG